TMNRLFNSLMVGLTMALAMGWVTRATAITTFGFYSADVGNPATAMDIQSPELQGWIEWASGRQGQDPSIAIQEGIISGTTNAWLNSDPGSTNPGYFIDVDTADQTKMYGYGWEYEAVVSLVSGGQFSAFGMDG